MTSARAPLPSTRARVDDAYFFRWKSGACVTGGQRASRLRSTSSNRTSGADAVSPATPEHPARRHIAYLLVGVLLGLTGGFANGILMAGIQQIQGALASWAWRQVDHRGVIDVERVHQHAAHQVSPAVRHRFWRLVIHPL
jgi:hypothetical protein